LSESGYNGVAGLESFTEVSDAMRAAMRLASDGPIQRLSPD
jgi:hypothetical protein